MSRQNSGQLYLSPNQQDLLMAALNSNQSASPNRSSAKLDSGRSASQSYTSGNAFFDPSNPSAPDSGQLDFGTDESPFLDFDLEGEGEDGFNFGETGRMIGDLPDEHLHDKRKSIGDEEEDDEGGGKRREGDDKSGKKPGRKPLTNEPTSKRKAQNRAAQRAFRERKEKHLKDLETKVEDLEKASESANHENGLLRAQVERLQIELKEYRKRLSWATSQTGLGRSTQLSSASATSQQPNGISNFGNDFQFEFPRFGDLPAGNIFGVSASQRQSNGAPTRSSTLPNSSNQNIPGVVARGSTSSASPRGSVTTYGSNNNSPIAAAFSASPVQQTHQVKSNSIDTLSEIFSPSIIAASRNAPYSYFPMTSASNNTQNNVSNSLANVYASSSGSNTDSPGSSSDSHNHTSSIGTSPEPSLSSPGTKLHDHTLKTINEENVAPYALGGEESFCKKLALACGDKTNPVPAIMSMSNGNNVGTATTGFDPNGINWLAEQNGGVFDPQLFGDYRESQDAVVAQDFGSFFNDAFPLPDLGSPQHNFNDVVEAEPAPKMDLMRQVEAAKDGDEEVVPGEDTSKMMTCNKIWDRLQSMEKFRNGEIDVDNLCSELRAKARCSEGGAVVNEKDVQKILDAAK